MKAVGVIVEYNPFHNGHAFHLEAAREAAGAQIVIAAMSGNFLQRGEPALVSKWMRAKMALLGGADIVFELPYPFAVQQAETFANGAVSLLEAAGCSALCFGSEDGDIEAFKNTMHLFEKNQSLFDEKVKLHIKTGVSYPKALSLSFEDLQLQGNLVNLSKPNNILGFQYIQALHRQKSGMLPLTIKRKHADYHDEHFSSETIASATSIRKALFDSTDGQHSIRQFIPAQSAVLLEEYYRKYGLFHHWENYWQLLKYRLLQMTPDDLRSIYEMEEGLEHRFLKASLAAASFAEFMEQIKTKRYTWTRLQRACAHILTNARKEEMVVESKKVSYLRLLGMSGRGREYLNKMKTHYSLPLVSKLSSFQHHSISLDIRASRIYSCAISGSNQRDHIEMEFRQPPIFVP
ncbi:MAG: nucleotidyltransferase [Bacillota bacterium]|nr:nucleotidyltransferase [Bacillota bacterium]